MKEINVTGFGKTGLNAPSKVFYFFYHKSASPYNTSVFLLNLLLLISKKQQQKTLHKGVAKARGRALNPYTITACLRDTTH